MPAAEQSTPTLNQGCVYDQNSKRDGKSLLGSGPKKHGDFQLGQSLCFCLFFRLRALENASCHAVSSPMGEASDHLSEPGSGPVAPVSRRRWQHHGGCISPRARPTGLTLQDPWTSETGGTGTIAV